MWPFKKKQSIPVAPVPVSNVAFLIEALPYNQFRVSAQWPKPRNEEDGVFIAKEVAHVAQLINSGTLFTLFQLSIGKFGEMTETQGVAAVVMNILNKEQQEGYLQSLVVTPEAAFSKD